MRLDIFEHARKNSHDNYHYNYHAFYRFSISKRKVYDLRQT